MSLRFEHQESEFQRMLAGAIRDMKDPRISPMTTVSHVELAKDRKTAKVYISVYDQDESKREETIAALNHAQSAIGRNVGKHMRIRNIPKLTFILDRGIEQSAQISQILDTLDIQPEAEESEEK